MRKNERVTYFTTSIILDETRVSSSCYSALTLPSYSKINLKSPFRFSWSTVTVKMVSRSYGHSITSTFCFFTFATRFYIL